AAGEGERKQGPPLGHHALARLEVGVSRQYRRWAYSAPLSRAIGTSPGTRPRHEATHRLPAGRATCPRGDHGDGTVRPLECAGRFSDRAGEIARLADQRLRLLGRYAQEGCARAGRDRATAARAGGMAAAKRGLATRAASAHVE